MKYLVSLLLVLVSFTAIAQNSTNVDTLYLTEDFEMANTKEFAKFMRVYEVPKDSVTIKHFRDYYNDSKKLYQEGSFKYFKGPENLHPLVVGSIISYYPNGAIDSKFFYGENGERVGEQTLYFSDGTIRAKLNYDENGLPHGEQTTYFQNGLVEDHTTFNKGKEDGINTHFSEDGFMYRREYFNDTPSRYIYVTSPEGYTGKYVEDSSDATKLVCVYDTPSSPSISYSNGDSWQTYVINGLNVSCCCRIVNEYGKYWQVVIYVANNSLDNINVTYNNMRATNGKRNIKVLTAYEFEKKVRNKQAWIAGLNGLANGLNAANAGYSYSSSTTNFNSYSTTNANAYAYGTGGYAYGKLSSTTTSIGTIRTNTREYDGFKAYQAQMIARNNSAQLGQQLASDRQAMMVGYINSNTLSPGETILGHVNMKYSKGDLYFTLNIQGLDYTFSWSSN